MIKRKYELDKEKYELDKERFEYEKSEKREATGSTVGISSKAARPFEPTAERDTSNIFDSFFSLSAARLALLF